MAVFKSFYTIVAFALICAFVTTSINIPSAQAGELIVPVMPAPGTMVNLSPTYEPAFLKGIVIHPENALKFDFIVNRGNGNLTGQEKQIEYNKLIKYFLASLAVPDKNQWVNLSPYEKNRIIEDDFGKTEMGRDLLAQDYLLKQITSSLIYPEKGLGKKFWDKVYAQAYKEYGQTDIPVDTFNKAWIVPDKAVIYEKDNTAYVVESRLKVMLEEDYLSLQKRVPAVTHTIASKVIRQVILPAIEKEVNEGRNFALLRQVYSGMLLAAWYKRALKESFLGKIYVDSSKVKGVDQDPKANEAIYHQYLQAFKKGVFNYIKEEDDPYTQQVIPRKYFSGGEETWGMHFDRVQIVHELKGDQAQMAVAALPKLDTVGTDLERIGISADLAAAFEETDVLLRQFTPAELAAASRMVQRGVITSEGRVVLEVPGNRMDAAQAELDGLRQKKLIRGFRILSHHKVEIDLAMTSGGWARYSLAITGMLLSAAIIGEAQVAMVYKQISNLTYVIMDVLPLLSFYLSMRLGLNEIMRDQDSGPTHSLGNGLGLQIVERIFRKIVPRKTYDGWILDTTDDSTVEPLIEQILKDYSKEEFVSMIASVTGRKVSPGNVTGRMRSRYLAEGSNKLVYLVEVETRRGPPLGVAVVMKKAKRPGKPGQPGSSSITGNEISDLKRLTREKEKGNDLPVPHIGPSIVTGDDRGAFLEQYIRGETAAELLKRGKLTLKLRRKIVTNLIKIGQAIDKYGSVPTDIHLQNWIIEAGNPIMIDIGKRRVSLKPEEKTRAGIQNTSKSKLFFILNLFHTLGYGDNRDAFILEEMRKELGDSTLSAILNSVMTYVRENPNLIQDLFKDYGRHFKGGRSSENKDELLRRLADDFRREFEVFVNPPGVDENSPQYRRFSQAALAALLLFLVSESWSNKEPITPAVDEIVKQLPSLPKAPMADQSPPEGEDRDGGDSFADIDFGRSPPRIDVKNPESSGPKTLQREPVAFEFDVILRLGSGGKEFEEFKDRFLKLFDQQTLASYISALNNQRNPITGQAYVLPDYVRIAANAGLAKSYTRDFQTAVIAVQNHFKIAEDGTVGPETRQLIIDQELKRLPNGDNAMLSPSKQDHLGGIDLNAANLLMTIRRDGQGVPLPLARQDMAQLNRIQGFVPHIIEIRPAASLPILSELRQKLQTQPAVLASTS